VPQLDVSTFSSQIFWLLICFGTLYYLLSRRALPRVSEILDARQDRIAADLDQAQRLRREAEAALSTYERAMAKAQDEAHALLAEVQSRLQAEAAERQAELDRDRAARLQALAERSAELDIAAGRRPLRDAVVEELARVESAVAQLDRQLADVDRLRTQHETASVEAQLAAALGRHLSARGFEKWVLDEALGMLVVGASEVLLDLSAGRYTLGLEERSSNFAVVDHREADQMRSARTLSGGETFLASLALALALADQLVLLAARGSARLDSIFLDEGFGTLDPDTLEVVAAAIEELGSRGRMVGVISHVEELAERVPVRFEVSSTPSGARVERVER
jgi:DNA repair protein SbcC/Rad50